VDTAEVGGGEGRPRNPQQLIICFARGGLPITQRRNACIAGVAWHCLVSGVQ